MLRFSIIILKTPYKDKKYLLKKFIDKKFIRKLDFIVF
ncbi:hypothetical protein ATPR_1542 [Acetobacter tropicalis NBRC 101654]|uniref:Uncharacterized protein n=1 Tax=Acetobacter tropicalis NBRC 101654 TaxID=749388 RepID=F7VDU3_9PROT|nr:hypothetical protein ATPR_1542 [Acetobacter tropicalis NBRC 101654]